MSNILKTDARLFAAVMQFISTEETRYYLCGVHVERHPSGEGIILVATDGHTMGVAYDKNGTLADDYSDGGLILSLSKDGAKALKCKRGELGRELVVALDTETENKIIARIHAKGEERALVAVDIHAALIDATYPDWRRILPDKFASIQPRAYFNPDKLEQFRKCGKLLANPDFIPAVNIMLQGDKDAAQVLISGHNHEFYGLIMPMQANSEVDKDGGWLRACRPGQNVK